MAAEGRFELFSNDSPFSLRYTAPFVIQGETFNCVLQYLMYRKADLFKDKEQAIDIMGTNDLKQIERYGKNICNVDTYTWNKERIKVAELSFQEKFTQNPDLKEQLLATFPRTMVYAITKDRFWGIGLSEQNPKALVMKEWKGKNVLGFTLTKIRDKLMENRLEEGGDGQDQRVEGQVSRDSMRQDGIGNSHVEEGHVSRDNIRQGGGGNSLGVGEQASWDSKRQHGIGNSHVVERHTSRDSIRQGGIENSHVVEGQGSRDSRRQGGIGNSHGLQGQANRDSKSQGRRGNSHRVRGNTARDSLRQGGGGNSHVVEEHASRKSLRQGRGGASQRTEVKTSRAYQEQGGDSKDRGVEGPTSQSRNRQGRKGKNQQLERPATHGSNRQDSRGWRGLEVGHTENHDSWEDQNWRDRSEVEWEKRGQPVTEGGEYRESERRSDWQKVAEEMPQWEETEPTSRPKRKKTQEQTDYNWNKHGSRNVGPGNTKASYTEMPNQDKFVLFFGNQSPFSQHHPATFTIDGTTFNCAEQYMMYQKTVIFENKEMERKIMEASNPVQQKRYGRQIPEFKFEVWKKHFIEVVDKATEAKFSQNPHLLEHLFATHPKLLVEASPSDRLWGIGRGQKDPLAWDKETWRGKNQLGYIITRVRDRLMKVKDTHWEEWEKWKDDKRWEEEEEREKREKRRCESDPYRGRHEERTPKTKRQGEGVHDGSMMLMKDDGITSQFRRESYRHVSGKENFEFFWGIKSPFSQLYPASFMIDGQTFTSAEHFTLYQMAVIFEDQECQKKIMSTSDPSEQERYAYEIQNFRWDVWEQKCVQVVERGITAKFTQNSELKGQLFTTYPKLLAECKYDDDYWSTGYGLGFAKKRSKAWDTKRWRGKNVLGYTLTAVRDRLMEMEKGKTELDVEDVRLQGTIEGDGAHLDRKILVEEKRRTGKEAAVIGEDGEIQQDVMTEKEEVNVEIGRSDADVEEDESKPHGEQDVRENWDSEEEKFSVGGSELRDNIDADITLAGDSMNKEEEVTQEPNEETFGGKEQDEMEESEMLGTEKEVLREATSVPEGMERDAGGGRKVMERVEKEGNDTEKDVKTEEEVTSPEGTERDCKGGGKARERVEKKGNDTGKEVKRDKEVPFVEGTSVVDVETLAGGERHGDDTKKDPEKVKSEQIDMDVEGVGVEDAGEDMKKLNIAGKEVKNGEDVKLVPEDNVIERQCEGERKDPGRETWADDALDEVKTEKRMPEAKTSFEEERDGEGRNGDEEEVEKVDTGDGGDVKTKEEVHITEDKSVKETDEGGKKGLELVEKEEDEGTGKEPTTVGKEFDARNESNISGEYERKAAVQQKKMSDSAESADLEEDITSGTGGEQDVMKEGGDVYTELAIVVGIERNPQTDKVDEEIDIIDPRGPNNKGLKGEAEETVVTEEVKAKVQKR